MHENANLDRQQGMTLKNKADLQLSTITGGAGELIDEQRRRFFKLALKQAKFTRMTTVYMMKAPGAKIPKAAWTGRVMYPASAGVPQPSAYRSAPSFSEITLESKLARAETHIDREVMEDNVERNALKKMVVQWLSEKAGHDIEDLLLNGDTSSSDVWLALADGLIKQATTNTASGSPSSLSKTLLRNLMLAMPEEYSEQSNMSFFTNRVARANYRDTVNTRATSLGDIVFMGGKPTLGFEDVPLISIPRFPSTLGTGTNETVVMMCNPKVALLAFQRRLTLDSEFDVRSQKFVFVLSLRIDVKWHHEPQVAKLDKVYGS